MNKPIISKDSSKLGRFSVFTLSKDQHTNQYLADELDYICLIPFDKSEEGSIKSIYVLEYLNPVTDSQTESLIIDTINPDLDKTAYDSVCRALVEEAGLDIDSLGVNENSIYYLGDIQMNFPMAYRMHCYGIDITSKSVLEFTRNLSKDHFTKDNSSIKKVGFHQVVNGDFPDSSVLAGSFLLVSYFS